MAYVDFINKIHRSTKRDYLKRVTDHDKAECAEIACKFGEEYWDGPRSLGYGGYNYDGRCASLRKRWPGTTNSARAGSSTSAAARAFCCTNSRRRFPAGSRRHRYLPVRDRAAKEEIRSSLQVASAARLPFPDQSFDLVYSINSCTTCTSTTFSGPSARWSALAAAPGTSSSRRTATNVKR